MSSGLFGVVLVLMIFSTGYDMFANIEDRKLLTKNINEYAMAKTNTCHAFEFHCAGKKHQAFIAFSICTNGERLFACKRFSPSSSMIQCMDGIRVITTAWVVFIHALRNYSKLPLHDTTTYQEVNEKACTD